MSMVPKASRGRSVSRFFLLLFGLCVPVWVLGAIFDVQLFPGFKLFQAGLAMPMIAALILTTREQGRAGVVALLRRTIDVGRIKPRIWFLPILLVYPSLGLINYCVLRLAGTEIPRPTFSLVGFLGYCTVFFMTFAEELGLTGYAIDPLQERHSALVTGLVLGLAWAGYHVPGFVISGYYTAGWIAWHAIYTVATRVLFVWIYNNSGKSLFSMALCHWTFGLFWSLWPQDNLQKAVPFYRPQITAAAAVVYILVVVYLWGPKTLARFRFRPA
ncbi:MAG TPA: CPBP family glutamic-type intramembrane protease [Anaeromyxobacteraceae bacterium]|nr:CPBP family glutamic-type intramembrane protease [Anaeromyxobacteraceae bacterium]